MLACKCCRHKLHSGDEYRVIYSGDAEILICESCICDVDRANEILDIILNFGDVLEETA